MRISRALRPRADGGGSRPNGVRRAPGWRSRGKGVFLTVRVPADSTATVEVPSTSGRVTAPDGARPVGHRGGAQIYRAGSGTRNLQVQLHIR
ncbi:hypothetical protein NRF20_03410 [Streptomyces sp. R-74717]|uniref:hypothetical protein n=1 Tax=Streptomyces sp. R-74717 TaxID=2969820 RepID=UPI0039B39DEB